MTDTTAAALTSVLAAVLPGVDGKGWVPALMAGFKKFGMLSHKRVAAAIGQFAQEAGTSFHELVEYMNYSTPERLHTIFPSRFPTVDSARPYVHNAEKLANHVYANRLGNHDEASGDGWRFRGRGLIQLTGRNEYSEFAQAIGMSPEEASDYCQTLEGAAMSGCWYLSSRKCLPMADAWHIDDITRAVNGRAMLGAAEQLRRSNRILAALGGN